MYKPSIAIVCMIRDPAPSIKTWIDYHLQQVDRIFFYLDEPGDGDEELLSGIPGVQVFSGDRGCMMLGANRNLERQDAIVTRAIEQCRKEGIDWLIHIDSDELMWSPKKFLRDYFAEMDADVSAVSFCNHEVVSRFEETNDCFKDFRLFKRNSSNCGESWYREKYGHFFCAYGNGKSAVRIAQVDKASGPHCFVVKAGRQHDECDAVCVLHYPCPTYRDWFKKYEQLGDFSDYWRDDITNPITFKFHCESRDAYLLARRELDWKIAEDFYKSRIFSDEDVQRMLNMGAVFWADPLADLARLGPMRPAATQPPLLAGGVENEGSLGAHVAVQDGKRQNKSEPSIAIVSTIKDPGPAIKTWISHHLRQVDRIFLYLDEPGNDDEALVSGTPGVTVFPGDQSSSLRGMNRLIEAQEANVAHALEQCRREGIDWLLHIDGNELLWSPGMPFRRYLSALEGDIGSVLFLNHEVVSQFDDVDDCFKQLRLFKRNSSRGEVDWLTKRGGTLFHAYANGKSMVRVADAESADWAHSFKLKAGRVHHESETTVAVLHYMCPTYSQWLKHYRQMGDFSNYWREDRRFPITENFHLQSRDAYLLARRKLDWKIAEDFYKSQLLEQGDVERLLNMGAVFWVDPLADTAKFCQPA